MDRVVWQRLGSMPYRAALAVQERIAEECSHDARPNTLLLVEHPPTITLGRRSSPADVLWSAERLAGAGIGVERVGRGGAATFHGPGQLVGYPIVRVPARGRGVREFVSALEAVLIDVAHGFGVPAARRESARGVWVGEKKLASIGIEVRRAVSRHGFALNVDMDHAAFAAIVPCGMPRLVTTDLSREAGTRITVAAAAEALIAAWRARFGTIEREEETSHVVEALR